MEENIFEISRSPWEQNPKLMQVSIPCERYLFEENDPADNFYIIQEGEIEISVNNGRQIFAKLSPGSSFGELALLGTGRRLASAKATTITKCLEISMKWMQEELDRGLPSIKSTFSGLAMQLQQSNSAEVAAKDSDKLADSGRHLPDSNCRSDLLEIFLRNGSYPSVALRSTLDIRNHIASERALVVAERGLMARRRGVSFELGEGAVIGLAECLAGTPLDTEFSFCEGKLSVTAWVIDTTVALTAIRRQNVGIVGVLRGLTAAITKSDVSARFAKK